MQLGNEKHISQLVEMLMAFKNKVFPTSFICLSPLSKTSATDFGLLFHEGNFRWN